MRLCVLSIIRAAKVCYYAHARGYMSLKMQDVISRLAARPNFVYADTHTHTRWKLNRSRENGCRKQLTDLVFMRESKISRANR